MMLVVLFMFALPLTQVSLDANLPQAARPSTQQAKPDSGRIVAELTADRRLSVDKRSVDFDSAADVFLEIFRGRTDKTLFLIGMESVRYDDIMRIIDAAKSAGVQRIGIVTKGWHREASAAR